MTKRKWAFPLILLSYWLLIAGALSFLDCLQPWDDLCPVPQLATVSRFRVLLSSLLAARACLYFIQRFSMSKRPFGSVFIPDLLPAVADSECNRCRTRLLQEEVFRVRRKTQLGAKRVYLRGISIHSFIEFIFSSLFDQRFNFPKKSSADWHCFCCRFC